MLNKSYEHINHNVISAYILLFFLALAIIVSNSSFYEEYINIVNLPISLGVGKMLINISFFDLVNDGLMAFFFLLLGLEMKYHMVLGEYQDKKKLILPVVTAIGGLIVPALIYVFFNYKQDTIGGWAIPIATDTAFVLCILSFFGNKIPLALRVFIIGFSLIDDALAIIILAIFYTPDINFIALGVSVALVGVLILLNYFSVKKCSYYLFIGILLWIAILQVGAHGTIAGIILALFIPVKIENSNISPNKQLEESLTTFVHYIILPIFVFINSEIVFSNINIDSLFSNLSLGIILGLFLGKQVGIFIFSYAAVKLKFCSLPNYTSWIMYYAVGILSGIGFTLSLFIGSLCFFEQDHINTMRFAIILASLLSAILGIILIKYERSICNKFPFFDNEDSKINNPC